MKKKVFQRVVASGLIAMMLLMGIEPASVEKVHASVEPFYEDVSEVSYSKYADEVVSVAILDTGITKYDVAKSISFVTSKKINNEHGNNMAEVLLEKAPDVSLYDVRVLDENGEGKYSDVSKGIYWAVDNGADIIAMSFVGYEASNTLAEALEYAEENEVLVIAAAGNDGVKDATYPSAYTSVISVGVLNENGMPDTNFNYGETVDIFVENCDGTSVATQHVAAMAARYMQGNPELSMREVRQWLVPERDVSLIIMPEVEEAKVYITCNHVSGSAKTVKEATCTASGLKEARCTKCGVLLYTTTISALGHTYGSWSTTKAATCSATGTKKHTCSRCGGVETQTISKTAHSWGSWIAVKAPTCTEMGTEKRTCASCGTTESRNASVLEHNYTTKTTTATCTAAGKKVTSCTRCGRVSSTTTIDALGHTYGSWSTTKAATCSATGTKKRTCSRCGGAETQTVSKTAHSWGSWVSVKAPTCTELGTEKRTCTTCGTTDSQNASALGHNDTTKTTEPTCAAAGKKEISCTRCGRVASTTVIAAKSHIWGGWTPVKAATCTEMGTEKRTCTTCGKVESRNASALGHNDITKTTEPTCATAGKKVTSCTRCGRVASTTVIAAKSHSLGNWISVKAPTCTEMGTEKSTCTVCGATESRNASALGHSDTIKVIASTCTVEGKTVKSCTRCGRVVSSTPIAVKGHSWGSWIAVKAPTCTEMGTEKRTCATCGTTDSQNASALGHNDITKTTEPTCATAGKKEISCTRCGRVASTTVIAAKSHIWGSWTPVKAATCTEMGTEKRTCATCGKVESRNASALGHNDTTKTTEPTCAAAGKKVTSCTRCGRVASTTVIAAKSHIWGSWTPVKAATCTEMGTEKRTCATCGKVESRNASALGHNDTTKTTEPTCAAAGKKVTSCTRCGRVASTTVIAAKSHSWGSWIAVKAPTCTEMGTEKSTCTVCGKVESRNASALGHSDTSKVIASTCTVEGKTVKSCTRCGRVVSSTPIAVKGHSWGNWLSVKAPTCTEMGTEKRTCTVCRTTESRNASVLGHNDAVETTPSTCSVAGKKVTSCTRCGRVVSTETLATKRHSWGNWTPVKTATCTEMGTDKRSCLVCGATDGQNVSALGHKDNGISKVTEPTCTKAGKRETNCTRCGCVTSTEVIAATGHAWGSWIPVKAATCTEMGTEKRTCAICGVTNSQNANALGHNVTIKIVDPTCTKTGKKVSSCTRCDRVTNEEAIAATGHTWGKWTPVKAATCTEMGTEKKTCATCGKTESQNARALGHNDVTEVTASTCTSEGKRVIKCARCKRVLKTEALAVKGHSWGKWIPVKAATCTEKGTEKRTCVTCGKTESRNARELGHNDTIKTTEPTCTTAGKKVTSCTRCGRVASTTEIAAKNHSWGSWIPVKAATCTEKGTEKKTCTTCGTTESRNARELGHNEVTEITASTCTLEGEKVTKCSRCKKVLKTEELAVKGHIWGKWIPVKAATCTEMGTEKRTCVTCGKNDSRNARELGHIEATEITASTCTSEGNKVTRCTRCKNVLKTEVLAVKEHVWGKWIPVKAPTCTEMGTEKRTCVTCGKADSRNASVLGHNEVTEITEPTCTTEGKKVIKCTRCECIINTEIIKALDGHKWKQTSIPKKANCTQKGTGVYICSVCRKIESRNIEATGHNYIDTEVKATCTTEGYTAKICKCGDVQDKVVYPPLDHHTDETITVVKQPTCMEEGLGEILCTREGCEAVLDEVLLPVSAHIWGYQKTMVEPTRTEDGMYMYVCMNPQCNATTVKEAPSYGNISDEILSKSSIPPVYNEYGEKITSKNRHCAVTETFFMENVFPVLLYTSESAEEEKSYTDSYEECYNQWLTEIYGTTGMEKVGNYIGDSCSQVALGNYTEDTTLLGTTGQVVLSLVGADLPADIRDISYDLKHGFSEGWTLSHSIQTIVDVVCLLPGIGAFKYSDEAADVAKATGKGTKKVFGEKIAKAVDMKNAGKASSTVDEAIHAADDIVDKTDEVAEAVTDSAIKNGDEVADGAGIVDDVVEGGSKSGYLQIDLDNLPQNVQDSFRKYDKAGWKGNVSGQAPGTNAGRKWRNNKAQLPQYDVNGNPITYREFDVNDYNGVQRDGERFIVGDDGSVWYSDSHYGEGISLNGIADFVQIR